MGKDLSWVNGGHAEPKFTGPDKFDCYVIQSYSYDSGEWDDVHAGTDLTEIKNERANYDRNEPDVPHRIMALWKSGKYRPVSL